MTYKQNKIVQFENLGLLSYQQAWDFQTQLFDGVIAQKNANRNVPDEDITLTNNYLLFLEHPPVYTLGKSGKPENLLISKSELNEKGIEYFPINRGGDITFHGPQQLVGYPILDLENFFTDIHKYLRYLEEAIILTCADYGVEAGRSEGFTGVWIENRKICAIGVRTSRWVSMHGFAFNINTDLSYFKNIIPCNISDKDVTSLERETGKKQDFLEVSERVKYHLAQLFDMLIVPAKLWDKA
jgi:lipoyl(octanoyl) transferase